MNKSEIINELHMINTDLGLKGQYVVTYGAAMVLLDVKRDTNDIDIVGSTDAFRTLVDQGFQPQPYNGDRDNMYIRVTEHVDMFSCRSLAARQRWGESFTTLSLDAADCDVMSLSSLEREFSARGREKDELSADLVRAYKQFRD